MPWTQAHDSPCEITKEHSMKNASSQIVSTLGHITCITSLVFAGALSAGCVASPEGEWEEETVGEAAAAVNGWYVWYHSTSQDTTGVDLGLASSKTCFLSGVAGNLSEGSQWQQGEPSMAWVGWNSGSWKLFAHGGALTNSNGQAVWENNPVTAHATCFYYTTNVESASWTSWPSHLGVAVPVKIANLDPNNLRQCFLAGVWSHDNAWDTSKFARVVKKTSTDATHPTTGWYVEANFFDSTLDGSHTEVFGRCVDFPTGTSFTTNLVTGTSGGTTTTITSGTGTKGCALTEITGAFNQNSWTDGARIHAPDNLVLNGNWTITVSNNKSARWACAE
jgi:hypothetical protein